MTRALRDLQPLPADDLFVAEFQQMPRIGIYDDAGEFVDYAHRFDGTEFVDRTFSSKLANLSMLGSIYEAVHNKKTAASKRFDELDHTFSDVERGLAKFDTAVDISEPVNSLWRYLHATRRRAVTTDISHLDKYLKSDNETIYLAGRKDRSESFRVARLRRLRPSAPNVQGDIRPIAIVEGQSGALGALPIGFRLSPSILRAVSDTV